MMRILFVAIALLLTHQSFARFDPNCTPLIDAFQTEQDIKINEDIYTAIKAVACSSSDDSYALGYERYARDSLSISADQFAEACTSRSNIFFKTYAKTLVQKMIPADTVGPLLDAVKGMCVIQDGPFSIRTAMNDDDVVVVSAAFNGTRKHRSTKISSINATNIDCPDELAGERIQSYSPIEFSCNWQAGKTKGRISVSTKDAGSDALELERTIYSGINCLQWLDNNTFSCSGALIGVERRLSDGEMCRSHCEATVGAQCCYSQHGTKNGVCGAYDGPVVPGCPGCQLDNAMAECVPKTD